MKLLSKAVIYFYFQTMQTPLPKNQIHNYFNKCFIV